MATAPATATLDNDFCWLPDVDLTDETRLREVVATVQEVVPDVRLHVSVLSAEQWQVAVQRLLPPRLRQNLAYHLHVLRDPRGPRRLLVGPSAVVALNEGSRPVMSEVAYALAQSAFEKTGPLLARGASDRCVRRVRDALGERIFCGANPQDARLVAGLVGVLSEEHGFDEPEWLNELAARPASVLAALRRSPFTGFWLQGARRDEAVCAEMPDLDGPAKDWLVASLATSDARSGHGAPLIAQEALDRWARRRAQMNHKESR